MEWTTALVTNINAMNTYNRCKLCDKVVFQLFALELTCGNVVNVFQRISIYKCPFFQQQGNHILI